MERREIAAAPGELHFLSFTSSRIMESSLYFPYKSIGVVTDGKPFVMNRLGNEVFLVASIGSGFQVYRFDKLVVCLVSQQCDGEITCLEVKGHETFVAIENRVVVYNRTRIVRTYKEHDAEIVGMCMVGDMLFTFDAENNMIVIDTKERSLLSSLQSWKMGPTYLWPFILLRI